MESFEQFKAAQQKLSDSRTHKITGSLGVYDAYKWIRKNKWLDLPKPVSEQEFYSIIRTINNYIAKELSIGNDVVLPQRMGRIELRKHTPFVGFKNDELKVNLSVDWDATLKLWYEDKEAFEEKLLVKIPEKEIFRFYYNKNEAHYTNQSFYELQINRDIKKNLKQQIKEGNVDAFLQSYGK